MMKDQEKEQRIKFQPEKKEEKEFFSAGEKTHVYFLCSTEKKLTRDQKCGSDVTQVTARGTFGLRRYGTMFLAFFSVCRIEYSTLSIG